MKKWSSSNQISPVCRDPYSRIQCKFFQYFSSVLQVFLNNRKILRIYLLFSFIIYLVYNQVYINRSRRVFCAFFYPKREKERVLHLYNNLLKRRRGLFKNMSKIVQEKLRNGRISSGIDVRAQVSDRDLPSFNNYLIVFFTVITETLRKLLSAVESSFIVQSVSPKMFDLQWAWKEAWLNKLCSLLAMSSCELFCLLLHRMLDGNRPKMLGLQVLEATERGKPSHKRIWVLQDRL